MKSLVIVYSPLMEHVNQLSLIVLIIVITIIIPLIILIGSLRRKKLEKKRIIEENYIRGKIMSKEELQAIIIIVEEIQKQQNCSMIGEMLNNIKQGLKKALKEKNNDH